jgi:hypothetical protein
MGCTGTCLSHTAGPRWIGGWNGLRLAFLLGFCLTLAPQLMGQVGGVAQTFDGRTFYPVVSGPDSVYGKVINGKTHEPVGRALVYTPDNRYATLTDDRGHFEFRFPPPEKSTQPGPTSGTDAEGMRKVQEWSTRYARPSVYWVRRPGYLSNMNGAVTVETGSQGTEMIFALEPEALIIGRVQLPGVDNTDRIQLQLYRQEFDEGHERWTQAGNFTTWATGEFRFSELAEGTYKLFTLERTERDPAIFNPGDQLYGFPPVFYPNASDFSAAAPIRLTAGATFQANLTVARREYYPVRIGVANPPAAGYPTVEVYLRGHPGPGYSLGYDPSEQMVTGSLPNGGYTLKLSSNTQEGSSGSLNFAVRGGPVEGPVVTLYPNVSLSVKIVREFQSGESPGGGTLNQLNEEEEASGNYASLALSPVEQFGIGRKVMAQRVQGSPEKRLMLSNVGAGTYWLQVWPNNCYAASATWGEADVLHRPLSVGPEGASMPIEVTLRNDGAEVMGKVQLPQSANSQTSNDGGTIRPMGPVEFVYFVPLDENSGQLRQMQVWMDGMFDATQIAPGTYRILAFDHMRTDLGAANSELKRKYETKGVVVELSASQILRLPSPLALVSEP